MTTDSAQIILRRYIERYINDLLVASQGRLRSQLLAMIKAADFASEICRQPFFDTPQQPSSDTKKIVSGLSALLPEMLAMSSTEVIGGIADDGAAPPPVNHLHLLGAMRELESLARSEDFGLCISRVLAPDVIELQLTAANEEAMEHRDRDSVLDAFHSQRSEHYEQIENSLRTALESRRALGIAKTAEECQAYIAVGRQYAQFYMPEYAEAEAFADASIIGPLSFEVWKRIVVEIYALGYAKSLLEDIELMETHRFTYQGFCSMPLTRISDMEFIDCVRTATQIDSPGLVDTISSCLILSKANVNMNYGPDGASPLLVRVDDDVVMTRFARYGNPYMFLVTRLSQVFRHQMRRVGAEREPQFQEEFGRRLDPVHYVIGERNTRLYRSDRSLLTDIDDVIYERSTNCVYFVQLKWFAVVAQDLEAHHEQYDKLRESGTEWIGKMHDWLGRTSASNVLKQVGLGDHDIDPSTVEIRLVILNRGWTRYSGKQPFDSRAAWLSWSRLLWLFQQASNACAPLDSAWREARMTTPTPFTPRGQSWPNRFPGLTVVVRD